MPFDLVHSEATIFICDLMFLEKKLRKLRKPFVLSLFRALHNLN